MEDTTVDPGDTDAFLTADEGADGADPADLDSGLMTGSAVSGCGLELRGSGIAVPSSSPPWRPVSEIILPMTFAAVLAIIFRPTSTGLGREGLEPSPAAG